MNFLNKLEKKFGKYAIPHLTVYIILTYVAGYILLMMTRLNADVYGGIFSYLSLSPSLILKGQIWRLVSWILIPPSSLDVFTIIMLICYYQLGTMLERAWGDFLYNFYIFFGLLMTVVGAFLLYLITGVDYGAMFSTYYVSLSIFLGFAMTFPDQQMLFMFIIPIKIKYLAFVDIIYLVYMLVQYARVGLGLPVFIMIVCSLASTIIFYFTSRNNIHFRSGRFGQNRGKNVRRRSGRRPTRMAGYGQVTKNGKVAKHRCAVCGRTELDDPNLEFRFCTRCKGNYEYCQDHLFNHKHVQ